MSLSKGPKHLNTDLMTADDVRSFLNKGIDDIKNGHSMPAKDFFANFRKIHADDTSNNLKELPKDVNADKMTDTELKQHLLTGYHQAIAGDTCPAMEVLAEMRAKYRI